MNTSQSIFLMNDQHRATESEWYCLEARTCGDKSDVVAYSCILELRDRIEALEAATTAQPNHPEIPGGSLKERIKSRMIQTVGSPWEAGAASVLVEVAAWLDTVQKFNAAVLLRLEAER